MRVQRAGDAMRVQRAGDAMRVQRAGDAMRVQRAGDAMRVQRAGDAMRVQRAGDAMRVQRAGDAMRVQRAGDAMRVQRAGDAMRVQRAGEEPHDIRGRGTPEVEATAAAGPGATPAVEAVAGLARLLPAEPPTRAPAGSRRSPAPPGSATDAPAAGPDVTVSIGHIEVRSAPVPDKPRSRPSFRPQVSLADFLGQQQDRRP